jgi:hypothetical protein
VICQQDAHKKGEFYRQGHAEGTFWQVYRSSYRLGKQGPEKVKSL